MVVVMMMVVVVVVVMVNDSWGRRDSGRSTHSRRMISSHVIQNVRNAPTCLRTDFIHSAANPLDQTSDRIFCFCHLSKDDRPENQPSYHDVFFVAHLILTKACCYCR
jgi:hypothetical protein